jgi:GNAT superfamily N-acetyltransferase
MRLVGITEKTQNAFYRCLNPKEPDSLDETAIRMRFYENYKDKGYRAKLLILDDGRIVGLCQYIPIEHSHLVGRDLLAILCIWVHGYARGVGNQQGKGYGRFIVNAIEEEARFSGAKGVAAWGLDWQDWMPVSFYEHMGYAPADREDKVVVVWKPFCADAEPPRLLRLAERPPKGPDRVNVTVAVNAWCGCYKLLCARKAIVGLEHMVDYTEVGASDHAKILHLGKVGGVFLDGEVFQPYQPCSSDALRAEIIRLYEQKQREQSPSRS